MYISLEEKNAGSTFCCKNPVIRTCPASVLEVEIQ